MSYREPGKIIRDVLISELGLTSGQVLFTNQKFEIPTLGLFIVLSYVGPSKIVSNLNEWQDDGAGGLTEIQSLTMVHMVQIDIMAYNDAEGGTQARARKEEVAMALRSLFSQSQQEKYSMQIARQVGAIMDTSFLEETEMMTRYTMTVLTTSSLIKTKPVDSYAAFPLNGYTDVSKKPFAVFDAENVPVLH